jgi:hypothetical protein
MDWLSLVYASGFDAAHDLVRLLVAVGVRVYVDAYHMIPPSSSLLIGFEIYTNDPPRALASSGRPIVVMPDATTCSSVAIDIIIDVTCNHE